MNLPRHWPLCLAFFTMQCIHAQTQGPGTSDDFYARGDAAVRVGHYDEAIDDLTKEIGANPGSARAYWLRAFANTQKQQYDASLADLGKAIELDPRNAVFFNNRGDVYRMKEDWDKAIADFTTSLRLDKVKQTYDMRGFCYQMKKDYDRAIQDYDRCIEIDPNYQKAYYNRARVLRRKKDYAHAIQDLNKALALDPKYSDAYDLLAWIYATSPDFTVRDGKKATEYALEAIQIGEFGVPGYYYGDLATAYAEEKDFPKAIESIQKCLADPKLVPEDRDFYGKMLPLFQAGKPYRDTRS